jgi:hypothetical protein
MNYLLHFPKRNTCFLTFVIELMLQQLLVGFAVLFLELIWTKSFEIKEKNSKCELKAGTTLRKKKETGFYKISKNVPRASFTSSFKPSL